jgi:MerR family transcriptional regulator, light-induced transcriptional regulator
MNLILNEKYDEYFEFLVSGNRKMCGEILKCFLDNNIDIRIIYNQLFTKSLYQIGKLWEYNKISVATEHLATSITEILMNSLYPYIIGSVETKKNAIISCVANEYHQIGGRMVADIFELNGWNTYFLGANTPVNDLLLMLHEKNIDIICLSLSVSFNLKNLIDALYIIKNNFPNIDILVGGHAFKFADISNSIITKFSNIEYCSSLEKLEKHLNNY